MRALQKIQLLERFEWDPSFLATVACTRCSRQLCFVHFSKGLIPRRWSSSHEIVSVKYGCTWVVLLSCATLLAFAVSRTASIHWRSQMFSVAKPNLSLLLFRARFSHFANEKRSWNQVNYAFSGFATPSRHLANTKVKHCLVPMGILSHALGKMASRINPEKEYLSFFYLNSLKILVVINV